ncbi:short-chain collagen C4-like [Saccostrea cucullata]|uniref:short-chain collagen C4-like n=1 Tax=Saccostrea cuccullata TaxID=36930 RepID=UPI002ED29A35
MTLFKMMKLFGCLFLFVLASKAETKNESCKDMLQGYLTGQLSSVLGIHQIEALKREFKTFTQMTDQSMKEFKAQVTSDVKNGRSGGVVYTRWGKKSCPKTADLVYSGFAGGSYYTHKGASVNPLCLPTDPEWGVYNDRVDEWSAYMYGAEYETVTIPDNRVAKLHNENVPCAVCLLRDKSIARVFPARKSCYKGWRLEYDGYLMGGLHKHNAGSMYTCVDRNPDSVPGGSSNQDGYLFYAVDARCGSLKCPPYVEGRELTCAVCSAP